MKAQFDDILDVLYHLFVRLALGVTGLESRAFGYEQAGLVLLDDYLKHQRFSHSAPPGTPTSKTRIPPPHGTVKTRVQPNH
jgi:hypothetical protein